MGRNPEVDAWMARYDNPMKPVVERIRTIVLAADSRIGECIKWQAPTFVYQGNLASFYPKSKQHASLMFHTGAQIPGKHARLEGTGDTSRVLKLASVAEADAAQKDIVRIVEAWCDWKEAPEKAAKPKKTKAGAAPSGDIGAHLRDAAMGLTAVSEGIACAGTALEKRTFKVKSKAFVFLGTADVMVKLKASLPAAKKLEAKAPEAVKAGANGWVKVTFGVGARSYSRRAPSWL